MTEFPAKPMDDEEPTEGAEIEVPEEDSIGEAEENEDGSAEVDLGESEHDEDEDFFRNLAEELPESELQFIASDLLDLIERDKESRKRRDEQQSDALKRAGLSDETVGGAEFDGASRVVHPVMTECCIDFCASAIKEICPVDGPVRTRIIGNETSDKVSKAERKRQHMNWQMSQQSKEFRSELEQLLTQLPMGGSQYLKIWWDTRFKKPRFEFVPIDQIYLPFSASNFYTAQRKTHVQTLTDFEFRRRVQSGQYRDIEAPPPGDPLEYQSKSERTTNRIEGKQESNENEDGTRVVLECFCYRDIADDRKSPNEVETPYIITIDESSSKVLSIYRNWDPEDETTEEQSWIVEFTFIPWRGAVGVGLPQIIGSLSIAATGALRALLDTAHISNSATLLKLKASRVGGQNEEIQITQVTEIEGPPGVDDVRKLAMPMPFNPPSPVLFSLLGWLTEAAKGTVTTAEEKIADASNSMPVGTTQALIEQGSKVASAIHARLHQSVGRVLEIVHRLNKQYLEDETTLKDLGELIVRREDYDGPMDVCPVSDPHIFSETQRIAQTQTVLTLASQAPQIYDIRAVHRRLLDQLKVPNINELMPENNKSEDLDPVSENVQMAFGKPAFAHPHQDHISHLMVLLQFMADPMFGQSPLFMNTFLPAALEHLKQHLLFWYAEVMGKMVQKASGSDRPLTELVGDDPHKTNLVAKAFSEALPMFQRLASANPVMLAAERMATQLIQKIQQMRPTAPIDPTQATLQATKMTLEAQSQKNQMDHQIKQGDLQLKTAAFQHKKEQDQLDLFAQKEKDEADIQAKMAAVEEKYRESVLDNQTAEKITLMRSLLTGHAGNMINGNSLSDENGAMPG